MIVVNMSVSTIERGIGRVQESIRGVRIPAPSLRGIISHPLKYVRLSLAAMAGLAMVACARQEINPATVTQEPNKATAAATLAPGVGGTIATYEAGHPNAGLNPIIDKINRGENVSPEEKNLVNAAKAKEAKANATSEAQKPPVPEPRVEAAPCTILSPELCRTAELIELPPNAEGQSLIYVGLNPPENTEIFMPITGQALKVTNPKGFNGNRVVAFRLDNPRFAISITGDLGFKSDRTENKTQGESIAVAKDAGIKNFGYRILFTASEFNDKDQTVTANRVIYELFPQLSNKTPRKVILDENPLLSSNPTKSTPIFLNKNP